jgi:hypothetical protein
MTADDVAAADEVLRLAFGKAFGLSDPKTFMGEGSYVRPRFRASPQTALVATQDDKVVGSIFATRWGSLAFGGPLSVHPDIWDRRVASSLVDTCMDIVNNWNCSAQMAVTFPNSTKHIHLYGRYGLWPRFLSAIFSATPRPLATNVSRFARLSDAEQRSVLHDCRDITDAIWDGLDVTTEILAINEQGIGDTVLLLDGDRVDGFACCHWGPNSEAETGVCHVKIGAARSGLRAKERLERLLDACESLAHGESRARMTVGANMARFETYQMLLSRSYTIELLRVAVHKDNVAAYNRAGVFMLDDLR